MRVSWEIVLGYKGVGGGERKGRDVDESGIFGDGCYKSFNKVDGIFDKESECAILVLAVLVAILCKETCTHFDLFHSSNFL